MADSMFDKVMAEEWRTDESEQPIELFCGDDDTPIARFDASDSRGMFIRDGRSEARAAIAVLGKRALALILEHEFCGAHLGECPECGGVPVELAGMPGGHAKDCEWGLVVAGVEKLRENAAAE